MPRFREHHLVLCLLVGAALLRLTPHPEDIAPIGAMALFAGAYLQKPLLWLVPLAGLLVGDMLNDQREPLVMLANGTGFLLATLIGRALLGTLDSTRRIAAALPLAVLACWVTATLGTALAHYSATGEGLATRLWEGLPLLAWHLAGDGVYAALLFGLYKLMREAPFVYYTPQN